MVRKANNRSLFTPFSHWLRENTELPSNGTVTTDLDFLVEDIHAKDNRGSILCVETKEYGAKMEYAQKCTLARLEAMLRPYPAFLGLWVVTLDGTSPEDGGVSLARYEANDTGKGLKKCWHKYYPQEKASEAVTRFFQMKNPAAYALTNND